MKRNQNILPAIGIGVVILLNIVFFGWLLADFFSGSNGPEETVAATGSEEETTDEETTGEETTESVESTPEETPSPKQIVGEVPLQDAKRVIHTFSWGNGEGQLGYNESEGDILRPQAFVVEDDVIYILDNANQRVLICENGRYSEIDLEHLPNISDMVYQNGWLAILDNSENVTKLYRNDNGVEMSVDLPEIVTRMSRERKTPVRRSRQRRWSPQVNSPLS